MVYFMFQINEHSLKFQITFIGLACRHNLKARGKQFNQITPQPDFGPRIGTVTFPTTPHSARPARDVFKDRTSLCGLRGYCAYLEEIDASIMRAVFSFIKDCAAKLLFLTLLFMCHITAINVFNLYSINVDNLDISEETK